MKVVNPNFRRLQKYPLGLPTSFLTFACTNWIAMALKTKVKINRKLLHLVSLVAGGLGFILIYYVSEPWMLHICFALVGIAWASILSMPYAMLSGSVEPNKMGTYMGIFNMFIVIPQIVAALGGVNFLYKLLFGEAVINTMLLAGTLLIVAGLCNLLITDRRATHD